MAKSPKVAKKSPKKTVKKSPKKATKKSPRKVAGGGGDWRSMLGLKEPIVYHTSNQAQREMEEMDRKKHKHHLTKALNRLPLDHKSWLGQDYHQKFVPGIGAEHASGMRQFRREDDPVVKKYRERYD